jgi:hypothetical protein
LPPELNRGGASFDVSSPWWLFERLQRTVAQAPSLADEVRAAFASLESAFFEQAAYAEALALDAMSRGNRTKALRALRVVVDSTTRRALELAERLTNELADRGASEAIPELADFWAAVGRDAGLSAATPPLEVAGGDP